IWRTDPTVTSPGPQWWSIPYPGVVAVVGRSRDRPTTAVVRCLLPEWCGEFVVQLGVADEARTVDRLVRLADVDAAVGEPPALVLEVFDDAPVEHVGGD